MKGNAEAISKHHFTNIQHRLVSIEAVDSGGDETADDDGGGYIGVDFAELFHVTAAEVERVLLQVFTQFRQRCLLF